MNVLNLPRLPNNLSVLVYFKKNLTHPNVFTIKLWLDSFFFLTQRACCYNVSSLKKSTHWQDSTHLEPFHTISFIWKLPNRLALAFSLSTEDGPSVPYRVFFGFFFLTQTSPLLRLNKRPRPCPPLLLFPDITGCEHKN